MSTSFHSFECNSSYGKFMVILVGSKRCLPGFWFEQENGCHSPREGTKERAGIRMRQ